VLSEAQEYNIRSRNNVSIRFDQTIHSMLKKTNYLCDEIIKTGKFQKQFNAPFFKEFLVKTDFQVDDLNKNLLNEKFIGGLNVERFYPELKGCWLLAATEKRTRNEIDSFVKKVVDFK